MHPSDMIDRHQLFSEFIMEPTLSSCHGKIPMIPTNTALTTTIWAGKNLRVLKMFLGCTIHRRPHSKLRLVKNISYVPSILHVTVFYEL